MNSRVQATTASCDSKNTTDEEPPLLRVMALHALAYCERLFYLEEVEEIRLADAKVYAGRADHRALDLASGEERRNFELESKSLGIMGKVDAVQHRVGGWVPYEFKRGRGFKSDTGKWEAWEADRLQVLAYALLLEEYFGSPVSEGRVRYLTDGVTVRVAVDEAAREWVKQSISRANQLRLTTLRPPVTSRPSLCEHCSLAPICLPEEERMAATGRKPGMRLFPPHPEGRTLHLTQHDLKVGRSAEQLVIKDRTGKEVESVPIREVHSLVIHGYAQVTTQALHLCASNQVAVHWLTGGGNYVAALSAGAGGVQRRWRQYEALADPATRLKLAKLLAHAKVEGQLRYLLRQSRGTAGQRESIDPLLIQMRQSLGELHRASDVAELRGLEGRAARAYFEALPKFLISSTPEEMKPDGRNRRPPRDPFNALLSFGYALLHRTVLQSILTVGLEPAFGFYHTPRSAAHPLALDLMELFRVPLVDIPLLGSINRSQWSVRDDFTSTPGKVWLSAAGRAKAIALWERRLEDTWKHPVLGYSLSYARTIELEVRLLEKEWSGREGLFARARLR